TRLDRPVHQQDDPGDQIAEGLLQTEADGETEGPGEEGQGGEIDAGEIDADEKSDGNDRDRRQFLSQRLLGWIEAAAAPNRLGDQPIDEPNDRVERDQPDQDLDQSKQGDAAG